MDSSWNSCMFKRWCGKGWQGSGLHWGIGMSSFTLIHLQQVHPRRLRPPPFPIPSSPIYRSFPPSIPMHARTPPHMYTRSHTRTHAHICTHAHTLVLSAQCGDMSTLSRPHSSFSAGSGSWANTSSAAPRILWALRAARGDGAVGRDRAPPEMF